MSGPRLTGDNHKTIIPIYPPRILDLGPASGLIKATLPRYQPVVLPKDVTDTNTHAQTHTATHNRLFL